MTKHLLWRGMLAGLLGGIVAATLALWLAEPAIDAAIGLEAAHHAHAAAEAEVVSRATQRGIGLYTAVALYGAALGGLFAMLFAAVSGRASRLPPRWLALALGMAGFAVVALVPAIRYPPNPPAVGLHDTIGVRTAAWFAMLLVSIVAAALAAWTVRAPGRLAAPDRLLCAAALYVVIVLLVGAALPSVDEVPTGFPASLLWRFRLGSIGVQAAYWLVMADLFGRMARRLLQPRTAS